MKTPQKIHTELDKVKAMAAISLLVLLLLTGVSFTSAILATSMTTSATFAGMVTACFISSGMTVLAFVCMFMLIGIGKKVSSS